MTRPLQGVKVAITENRYPEQLALLLERQGASVTACPLLRETPVEDAEGARRFMELCESGKMDYIVFYTGVGVDFLFRTAGEAQVLERSRILARGPKAVNALKRAGVRADLVADSATTSGIVQTLSREELNGKTVLVQLYGSENRELAVALEARGARVIGVSLYRYTPASDSADIERLVRQTIDGGFDAITFTSATQVPFLFDVAERLGLKEQLKTALGCRVVVASVGEVTSRALREEGVIANVEPPEAKMGPMVKALCDHFESRRSHAVSDLS
jgi:uroporphyrinogen-III synthase